MGDCSGSWLAGTGILSGRGPDSTAGDHGKLRHSFWEGLGGAAQEGNRAWLAGTEKLQYG